MSRDEAAYLEDMVEACTRVIEYTAGIDAAALRADRKTIDAVVRNGDATARRVDVRVIGATNRDDSFFRPLLPSRVLKM